MSSLPINCTIYRSRLSTIDRTLFFLWLIAGLEILGLFAPESWVRIGLSPGVNEIDVIAVLWVGVYRFLGRRLRVNLDVQHESPPRLACENVVDTSSALRPGVLAKRVLDTVFGEAETRIRD